MDQKRGDLSDFEREQFVDAHLAGVSVAKTATLLSVVKLLKLGELIISYFF
jgi:hypothetical protein